MQLLVALGLGIASVGVITCFSSSDRGAFINSFLYMFGMTLSFYGLKSILGLYMERFSSESHFPLSPTKQGDMMIIQLLKLLC